MLNDMEICKDTIFLQRHFIPYPSSLTLHFLHTLLLNQDYFHLQDVNFGIHDAHLKNVHLVPNGGHQLLGIRTQNSH